MSGDPLLFRGDYSLSKYPIRRPFFQLISDRFSLKCPLPYCYFQIFEDMISLLQTVERKAVKFGRRTSEQIESVKAIASNILLKVKTTLD